MDNLSAHKLKIIEPLIQSVGWIYSHFKKRWKTFSAPNLVMATNTCINSLLKWLYIGKLTNPFSPRYLCVKNNNLLS